MSRAAILFFASAITCVACASVSTSSYSTDTTHPGSTSTSPHNSLRTRKVAKSFADLLRTPAGAVSTAGNCLLIKTSAEVLLGAAPTPATKAMPQVPEDLVQILAQAPGPARILSPWGRLGPDGRGPVLVTLTRVPVRAARMPTLSLFVTQGELYVRAVQNVAFDLPDSSLSLQDLLRLLAQHSDRNYAIFVTADADLPANELVDALAKLPTNVFVTLCVALPAGTVVPAAPSESTPTASHCEALPEPNATAIEGDLPLTALKAGLSPMQGLATRCMESSSAANHGRVVLALRIADGRVQDVCLVEDEIQHETLATCLVESAKTLRFDPGPPNSFVDVHLPLQLVPIEDPAPTPVCER